MRVLSAPALAGASIVVAMTLLPGEPLGPRSRGDVVGKPFGSLDELRWIGGESHRFAAARLTLVRWWTDGCPHCEASIPALRGLQRAHAASGLALVSVYHAKPRREVSDAMVKRLARRLGLRPGSGEKLAVDADWKLLTRVWLRDAPRRATSVTFLVDRDGVVRFVHPGPRLHRSDDPRHERADRDMKRLEAVVRELLAEPEEEPAAPASPSGDEPISRDTPKPPGRSRE